MSENKVIWIEPDNDDFELVTEIVHQINPHFQIIRYLQPSHAIKDLESLEVSEFPSLIITEYSQLWVNALGKLEEIASRIKDRRIPVIVFTGNQNPQIVQTLPQIKVIVKPFNYRQLDIIVHEVVRLVDKQES